MGLYQRYVLPYVLDMAMSAKPITYQRRKVVPLAEGRVLEIGFGAGHNAEHYDPAKVTHLWGLEPDPGMRKRAAKRIGHLPFSFEFLGLEAERIPLPDHSADTVLVTYTLCSIPQVQMALEGMRRVLKPSGRLIFCEHGEAPDASVRKWQDRLQPLWGWCGGGCHLGRPIPKLITGSGFRIDNLDSMYLPSTPRFAGYNYWGTAQAA
ncbi:MAG TPA: SAM-dependent methyltransferase [Alphaproteobacteria bacterium]|nr:SAM-dependent methyltransferase [Alphaproteobacteria bacterium]HAJ46372.1 SAM-dependent methyltransferase [Alphaproteobacteria bacterium]